MLVEQQTIIDILQELRRAQCRCSSGKMTSKEVIEFWGCVTKADRFLKKHLHGTSCVLSGEAAGRTTWNNYGNERVAPTGYTGPQTAVIYRAGKFAVQRSRAEKTPYCGSAATLFPGIALHVVIWETVDHAFVRRFRMTLRKSLNLSSIDGIEVEFAPDGDRSIRITCRVYRWRLYHRASSTNDVAPL